MDDRRKSARQAEVQRNDQALLAAARAVLAEDGAHASVAAIAARAGVGIGSLYRRYPTKEALFVHLSTLALHDYLAAAEEGLRRDDPWDGLAHYIQAAISFGPGSLAPIAGTIPLTAEMTDVGRRGDAAVGKLVRRAHRAKVLRRDVTEVDIALLVEQLARSPLVEQLTKQGHTKHLEAALEARARTVAIALDGLRAPAPTRLPGKAPSDDLFSVRWSPPSKP